MAPVPVNSNSSTPKQSSTDLAGLTSSIADQIPLGEYFFRRVKSLGVSSCFAVPGDYNLFFLDHSYNVSGMSLRNCCNELNTAYAADGYARASKKLGVAITTFGVGELSAINGISGATAEFVPVLHVVGTTPCEVKQKADNHTHHLLTPVNLLQPSDHHIYEKMASMVSCCVESISDVSKAPEQIDNVLRQILVNKKPGYLYVPSNLANCLVSSSRLQAISGEEFYRFEDLNPARTSHIAEQILEKIYSSSNPAVIGDVFIDRYQLTASLRKFVQMTGFKSFSTVMGKSILDETSESYVGDYWGKESNSLVEQAVLGSDLVLHFGEYHNEINSGHYTMYSGMNPENIVFISAKYTKIGSTVYESVDIVPLMNELLAKLDGAKVPKVSQISEKLRDEINTINDVPSATEISQTDVLQKVAHSLQPGDYIVCETGSFMFGIPDLKLPQNARYFGQNFYLSIGYALPATLGIGCAMKDQGLSNRLILFEGDGAAQMTIQEFANYLNQGIKPTIFLLNNNGYTVERIINGPELSYNDIMPDWKWTQIFETFGDHNGSRSEGFKVSTKAALDKFFKQHMSSDKPNDKLKIVEITLDKYDVPWRFNYMIDASK